MGGGERRHKWDHFGEKGEGKGLTLTREEEEKETEWEVKLDKGNGGIQGHSSKFLLFLYLDVLRKNIDHGPPPLFLLCRETHSEAASADMRGRKEGSRLVVPLSTALESRSPVAWGLHKREEGQSLQTKPKPRLRTSIDFEFIEEKYTFTFTAACRHC